MRPVAVLLIFVITAGVAHGDTNDALDDAAARRHFQRATDALRREDYETALREFKVVRAIRPLPDIDYNIARCFDAMERWKEAAAEYRKYLSSGPDAVTAEMVRQRVVDPRAARRGHRGQAGARAAAVAAAAQGRGAPGHAGAARSRATARAFALADTSAGADCCSAK